MKRLQKLFVLSVLLMTAVVLNAQVTVSSFRGVDIELGGHVELEFVDVEGPGGFANQDLTVMKVKTRSPHVRIDEAVLEARVNYSENLQYVIEYRFDNNKAYVDIHYVSLNVPSMNTRFEFGNNKPFVAPKRYTEGNPLIGTAYWKGREEEIIDTFLGFKLNMREMISLLTGEWQDPDSLQQSDQDQKWAFEKDREGRIKSGWRNSLYFEIKEFVGDSPLARILVFESMFTTGRVRLIKAAFNRPVRFETFSTGFLQNYQQKSWEEIQALIDNES